MPTDPYDAPSPARFLHGQDGGDRAVVLPIPDVPDPGMVEVDTPKRGDDVALEPLSASDVEDGDDVGEVELADPITSGVLEDDAPTLFPVTERPGPKVSVDPPTEPGFDDDLFYDEVPSTGGNAQIGLAMGAVAVFVVLSALCLFGGQAWLSAAPSDAEVDHSIQLVPVPSAATVSPSVKVEAPLPVAPSSAPVAPALPPVPPMPAVRPPVRPRPRPRPRSRAQPIPSPSVHPAPSPGVVLPSERTPAPTPTPGPASAAPSSSPWDTPE